jgi:hypothetical protein
MNTPAQKKIINNMRDIIRIQVIRTPYLPVKSEGINFWKTYFYLDGDLWSALIALACIIILLSIVGIIVICFLWAR